MKPSPLSIYPVGLALLGIFGAAAWAVLRAPEGTETRLTKAAKSCGFADPRFVRRGDTWMINETLVTGRANPPVPPAARQQFERSRLLETKLMPCLRQAAKTIGVRVDYEKTVMVN